jgi:hypothetical protein
MKDESVSPLLHVWHNPDDREAPYRWFIIVTEHRQNEREGGQ